ncbi:hypothetical protein BKP35_03505 [Anaerobacillus arseniciselenatis]|uniref:Competence protein ComG n=1 Tax=Anaerobacillus arseniciselenatis TaxID=85682 RepID=A0A1S2LV32_9BACI|nr:competence type IV pilus minor pilin ComGG [Anaerobacillus arseniciselenatis]OIJ16060.1 hypothetical protein BKP35_03505 [Anaerobacillus arseniciselenatis]
MNNERGFILPITLFVVFLLSSFVTFQLNQYMIEKEIMNEKAEAFTAERLIQMAIVDLEDVIVNIDSNPNTGTLYYENGEVMFIIDSETDEIKSIHLISKTSSDRSKQMKYYYYLSNETVLPWLIEL